VSPLALGSFWFNNMASQSFTITPAAPGQGTGVFQFADALSSIKAITVFNQSNGVIYLFRGGSAGSISTADFSVPAFSFMTIPTDVKSIAYVISATSGTVYVNIFDQPMSGATGNIPVPTFNTLTFFDAFTINDNLVHLSPIMPTAQYRELVFQESYSLAAANTVQVIITGQMLNAEGGYITVQTTTHSYTGAGLPTDVQPFSVSSTDGPVVQNYQVSLQRTAGALGFTANVIACAR
jgi:hypothetical protein